MSPARPQPRENEIADRHADAHRHAHLEEVKDEVPAPEKRV
jgi:hypothetical protein